MKYKVITVLILVAAVVMSMLSLMSLLISTPSLAEADTAEFAATVEDVELRQFDKEFAYVIHTSEYPAGLTVYRGDMVLFEAYLQGLEAGQQIVFRADGLWASAGLPESGNVRVVSLSTPEKEIVTLESWNRQQAGDQDRNHAIAAGVGAVSILAAIYCALALSGASPYCAARSWALARRGRKLDALAGGGQDRALQEGRMRWRRYLRNSMAVLAAALALLLVPAALQSSFTGEVNAANTTELQATVTSVEPKRQLAGGSYVVHTEEYSDRLVVADADAVLFWGYLEGLPAGQAVTFSVEDSKLELASNPEGSSPIRIVSLSTPEREIVTFESWNRHQLRYEDKVISFQNQTVALAVIAVIACIRLLWELFATKASEAQPPPEPSGTA